MKLVTYNQAAELLKKDDPNCPLGPYVIRKLARQGKIPSIQVGEKKRLINYDVLTKILQSGTLEQGGGGDGE
jgi:hypothetical protein